MGLLEDFRALQQRFANRVRLTLAQTWDVGGSTSAQGAPVVGGSMVSGDRNAPRPGSDAEGLREVSGVDRRDRLIAELPGRPDERVLHDIIVNDASGWDVKSANAAIWEHQQGQFYGTSTFSDFITRDDRYQSAVQTRVLGLQGVPFEIHPATRGTEKPSPRAIEVAKALEDDWSWIFPEEVLSQLLAWSIPMGFVCFEIIWDTVNDKGRWIPTLRLWHSQHIYYNLGTRRYVALSQEGPIDITPGDGKWFLYTPWGLYRGWMWGAIRALAIPFLARQYTYRDWARYSEVHGLPIRGAKVPQHASDYDKQQFYRQVSSLGARGTLLLPVDDKGNGFDLALIEAANHQSWEGFERLILRCDAAINLTVLGQNMSGGEIRGGSYAAAKVADGVRDDYKLADAEKIARQIRVQVVRPWTVYNFGDELLSPHPKWEATPPDDKAAKADTFKKVADGLKIFMVDLGMQPKMDQLVEDYELPFDPDSEPNPPPPPPPPAPTAPMVHSRRKVTRDDHVIAGQAYVDDVTDDAEKAGAKALEPMLEQVIKIVKEARDYDQLRHALLNAFRGMDPERMRLVVEGATKLATHAGVFSVHRETEE